MELRLLSVKYDLSLSTYLRSWLNAYFVYTNIFFHMPKTILKPFPSFFHICQYTDFLKLLKCEFLFKDDFKSAEHWRLMIPSLSSMLSYLLGCFWLKADIFCLWLHCYWQTILNDAINQEICFWMTLWLGKLAMVSTLTIPLSVGRWGS